MPTTTTYFNPNIRPALIQALESAENELIIAVCWFNDTTLLDVLIQALSAKPELIFAKKMSFGKNNRIQSLEVLKDLVRLENLNVTNFSGLTSLAGIENFSNL